LNEGLGGTVEFGEDYLFPRDLGADKVKEILSSDQDADVYGSQFPGFSVESADKVRYDLISLPSTDSVVGIGVYDIDEGEVLDFYEIEDIPEA